MEKIKKVLFPFLIPIIVLTAWIYITQFGKVPSSLLPRVSSVGEAFKRQIENGQLVQDLGVSLGRVVKGYAISIVLGILLGALMGMSKSMWHLFHGVTTTIRQIPMMAWIPLIILWCGIKELSKVVIIVIAAFFPIMTNTLGGITSTPKEYIEVAKLYKLSKWKTFTKVYLPHAIPQIFVGLKLGLGTSWMAVVAAELIASVSGIGYRLSDARNMMRSDVMIVCMIVIGLVGALMDKIISLLFGILTPWEKKGKAV